MTKHSAGLLMYRFSGNDIEVFLVHPGGPFWAKKDVASWSIPKGEFSSNENSLEAARREFEEETGFPVDGKFTSLDMLKQPSGKIIHAWAFEGDCDSTKIKSNTFSMEWPPKSGKEQEFPEIDKAGWFNIETAKTKLHKGQVAFIDRLLKKLNIQPDRNDERQMKGSDSERKMVQQLLFY